MTFLITRLGDWSKKWLEKNNWCAFETNISVKHPERVKTMNESIGMHQFAKADSADIRGWFRLYNEEA